MKEQLLSILPSLHEGYNRLVCPFCSGGSKKEKSFVVTKQGRDLQYMCHRASCNARGSTKTRTHTVAETSYHPAPVTLPDPNSAHYARRDVKDNTGKSRGAVWRRKKDAPKELPKDINRIDSDWCKLHFPAPIRAKTVILVEDIISANKMNRFYPCIALLGVHLNEAKLEYLIECGVSNIILALDNDATRQAIRIARKWCISTKIMPLQRDLKDETDERLKEIAEGL